MTLKEKKKCKNVNIANLSMDMVEDHVPITNLEEKNISEAWDIVTLTSQMANVDGLPQELLKTSKSDIKTLKRPSRILPHLYQVSIHICI
jgi:hypothetical protein